MHSQTRNNANAETNSKQQGAIAQLVEQRTENPCVPGSIPGGTTKKQLNPDFKTKSGFLFFGGMEKCMAITGQSENSVAILLSEYGSIAETLQYIGICNPYIYCRFQSCQCLSHLLLCLVYYFLLDYLQRLRCDTENKLTKIINPVQGYTWICRICYKIDVFCQNFRPVNVTSICNFVTLYSDFK